MTFDKPGTVGTRPGIIELMRTIERVLPDGGDWCDLHKAHTLASLVIALRPRVIVEIGVWMGGSLIPMALALKWVDEHAAPPVTRTTRMPVIVGIDPWSPVESVQGESDAANLAWWSHVDHEAAFRTFCRRVTELDLGYYVNTVRLSSDQFDLASANFDPALGDAPIDLLHIDGNHTEQAHRDAVHYLPFVRTGGIVVFDDVGWGGGGVARGVDWARENGFVDLYVLGTGIVMQRMIDPDPLASGSNEVS